MSKSKVKITGTDASRIQAAEAKENNGKVTKGGFAARAQRAAEQNKSKKSLRSSAPLRTLR